MKVVVLQSNYIPWKGYFDLINDADVFCFYDEVKYTKNDWRNRNKLLSSNGSFWISIPIHKDSVKLKISEVEIADIQWQAKHFKSIEQTYAKAPFKNEILQILSPFYLEKPYNNLSLLNQEMIKCIAGYIGIKTKFDSAQNYTLSGNKVDKLINLILQLRGNIYISGPAAKDYLVGSEHFFSRNGINLVYKTYGPYKSYDQSTKNFENTVSVIDLLMNVPKAQLIEYIRSQNDSI